jgi:hypothetical protein
MTRELSSDPSKRAHRKSDVASKPDESLAEVLAELRRITSTRQAEQRRSPDKPHDVSRPGPTAARVRSRPRLLYRTAGAGGVVLLAAALAMPLSNALFVSADMTEPEASHEGPVEAAPLTFAQMPETRPEPSAAELLPQTVQEPTASTAPVPEVVPAAQAESPASTASVQPMVVQEPAQAPAAVELPTIDLPGPLHIGEAASAANGERLVEPEAVAESADSATEPPEAAVPQPEGSASSLTIASLGDVVVPLQRTPPTALASALVVRAKALIENRDISSARLLLERAMVEGSAEAAFHLAETYDPRMLEAWRVIGPVGDAARARHLYEQAANANIVEARERLAGMP